MLPIGQHTLVTQPDNDDAFKHCILVKLTESSAQAIEDYLRMRVSFLCIIRLDFNFFSFDC